MIALTFRWFTTSFHEFKITKKNGNGKNLVSLQTKKNKKKHFGDDYTSLLHSLHTTTFYCHVAIVTQERRQ